VRCAASTIPMIQENMRSDPLVNQWRAFLCHDAGERHRTWLHRSCPDFGHGGKEFWHTWWPRGDETLNSPEFKAELNGVVDEFRKTVLKDLSSMSNYCYDHGGELSKDSDTKEPLI